MPKILKQEEIEALLSVCEDTPSDTDRSIENLQGMHTLIKNTPVKGTVNNTYIEIQRDAAEMILLHLQDTISLLKETV